ncbi:Amino acid ABC transporter ATP-binding protein, PAAT family [Candidatus Terasakiella magnetica]|uniref:Amino acid ABC transporter ATP-binding protein, PAAT family n=1 Tax=Candidatus Terasakiella magnetica TaxID=1867952 RepID=A0A1C3RL42_9PROT|nr:phosphate ABC transporter ATP-binding protein [Candidatus Terasakiella magnetica]SCA57985.1 Amino acid ABC transporter ATP-binding protein, PAAT family [Candidatus Terasakiella magnetica]
MSTILPLKVKDVNFIAGDKRLIKDMNFQVKAGARVMVLGANGAGKSLLLRICHGLLPASSGEVFWNGQAGFPKKVRKHQAMVFQRPVLLRRTALANIEYALKRQGIHRSERRDMAYAAMKKVGLGRLAEQPARVLSGGEQQRLAMARAWAIQPEVLFLDEPCASLDPSATHSIEETIEAFVEKKTTIIMTTHDLGQAKRLGSDVMFMHRGRVLEKANVKDFFTSPQNDLAQAFVKGELLWWKRKEPYPGGGMKMGR